MDEVSYKCEALLAAIAGAFCASRNIPRHLSVDSFFSSSFFLLSYYSLIARVVAALSSIIVEEVARLIDACSSFKLFCALGLHVISMRYGKVQGRHAGDGLKLRLLSALCPCKVENMIVKKSGYQRRMRALLFTLCFLLLGFSCAARV